MKRQDAYNIIDGEREYQEALADRGVWLRMSRSPMDWLADIRVYSRKAEEDYVNTGDDQKAMSQIRKIAALCVAAIEVNGAPPRIGFIED